MPRLFHIPTPATVFILVAVLLLPACDEDTVISPFSDREAYFTLFGSISISDTQYVRVIPIRNGLERDVEPTQLDVVVTTTEERSGRVQPWTQVLPLLETGERGLIFSDSTFGHVFRAIFTPVVGERYRLEVTRPDGKSSEASTTVPGIVPPVISNVWSDGDTLKQSVTWPGVNSRPFRLQMVYRVTSPLFYPEIQFPAIPLDYSGRGEQTVEGWRVDVDLARDVGLVRQFVADNFPDYSPLPTVEDVNTFPLASIDIRMRAEVVDSVRQSLTEDLDVAVVSQPGAISNVERGFGFFGAHGSNTLTWELPTLPDSTRFKIGFDG